jgi:gas vesicle protein
MFSPCGHLTPPAPLLLPPPRRAERGSSGFVSGFVLGGVVCGVLGFVFAPQISRALLGDDQRIRLPRFMEGEELDPEVTKQNLAEKIAQLNSSIDEVSAQLRAQETESDEVTA